MISNYLTHTEIANVKKRAILKDVFLNNASCKVFIYSSKHNSSGKIFGALSAFRLNTLYSAF